jgi:hypothetical protein
MRRAPALAVATNALTVESRSAPDLNLTAATHGLATRPCSRPCHAIAWTRRLSLGPGVSPTTVLLPVYAKVSAPDLRLAQAKLSRNSKRIGRERIRQFESHMASQAVDSTSADCARSVAVAVIVSVYALVADRARRSAVAVAISVLILAAAMRAPSQSSSTRTPPSTENQPSIMRPGSPSSLPLAMVARIYCGSCGAGTASA